MEKLDSPICFLVVTKIIEDFLKDPSVFPLFPEYLYEDIIIEKKRQQHNYSVLLFNDRLPVWVKSVFKFIKAYLDK